MQCLHLKKQTPNRTKSDSPHSPPHTTHIAKILTFLLRAKCLAFLRYAVKFPAKECTFPSALVHQLYCQIEQPTILLHNIRAFFFLSSGNCVENERRRAQKSDRDAFYFSFQVRGRCGMLYTLANRLVLYACESVVAISQSATSAPVAVVAANRDFKNVHDYFFPCWGCCCCSVRTAYPCVNENSNIGVRVYVHHNYLSFTHINDTHHFCRSI